MVHKLFIDGEWVESTSGKTFKSFNPATGKKLGEVQSGNKKDVDKAVKAACNAFDEWRLTPPPERGDVLLEVAGLLEENKQRLGELVTREMGKQISEGKGDVQEAIDIFKYMAGEGRRLLGHTTTSELENKFAMTVKRPVGPSGLITPWNFPIAIPAWKLSPALICGNSVVFKPASGTPLCAVELVKILEEAGVSSGVVNLVTGSGSNVGTPMVEHPDLKSISFTGSRKVGKLISRKAGLKNVGLELGGKNPIIVMDDANLDLAVEGAIWGGFGTTGQRCTAASRVIVHEDVEQEFMDKFVEETKKLSVGNGMECDIGPLINEDAVEKTEYYIQKGKEEGAELVIGGEKREGLFFDPTIFTNVEPNMAIAQEEIFGPVVSVLTASSLEEAIEIANGVDYGLSTSIYTENVSKAFNAIRDLDAGLTYVNSSTIGSEVHLPFGGVKKTGNGTREAGIEGVEEFTETKTVYVDYSGQLQKAQGID